MKSKGEFFLNQWKGDSNGMADYLIKFQSSKIEKWLITLPVYILTISTDKPK